jgi:transcriptional regulator with XRE-family HTH domain
MKYKVNAEELKVEMIRHKMNNEELAKACDVHFATISRLLNGGTPTYSMMCKISNVLKLAPERATEIFFAPDLRNTQETVPPYLSD